MRDSLLLVKVLRQVRADPWTCRAAATILAINGIEAAIQYAQHAPGSVLPLEAATQMHLEDMEDTEEARP